jgi:DNA polymerase III delta prime subunit
MPNIAAVLREEVVRLARKEIRRQTSVLRKASAQYRKDIAEIKRRVSDLRRKVSPEWHFHKTYVAVSRRALATGRGSFR